MHVSNCFGSENVWPYDKFKSGEQIRRRYWRAGLPGFGIDLVVRSDLKREFASIRKYQSDLSTGSWMPGLKPPEVTPPWVCPVDDLMDRLGLSGSIPGKKKTR